MQRTIIVGDIHGCFDELLDLLDRVGATDDDLLLSVGDLVDRGPKPAEVVELFRTRPNSKALMGNHERKHVRSVFSYSQHVTKLQIGERYADQVGWMSSLPYFHETAEVRVVHWGLYPGVPLGEVPEDVLSGTTSGDVKLQERYGKRPWYEFYQDEKPVVFGHSVVGPDPLVIQDRIFGIDTGACHGMRLTALVLPELKLVSVPARADHWVQVREQWQEPVLRTHPWRTMTFEQVAKKTRSLRDPELTGGFLDQVEHWVATVRGLLPGLALRLDVEVARILEESGTEAFGRVADAHPAASWLHRQRAGRLSREHLGCSNAEQVFALAKALGVEVEVGGEP